MQLKYKPGFISALIQATLASLVGIAILSIIGWAIYSKAIKPRFDRDKISQSNQTNKLSEQSTQDDSGVLSNLHVNRDFGFSVAIPEGYKVDEAKFYIGEDHLFSISEVDTGKGDHLRLEFYNQNNKLNFVVIDALRQPRLTSITIDNFIEEVKITPGDEIVSKKDVNFDGNNFKRVTAKSINDRDYIFYAILKDNLGIRFLQENLREDIWLEILPTFKFTN